MPAVFGTFLIGVVILLPFFFLAALNFDRLVRRLFEHHREEWNRLGGPRGYFWTPPEGALPTAGVAFMKCSMAWVFRLPDPLASDPEARRLQTRLRLSVLVWNAGCLTLFGVLYKLHGFPFAIPPSSLYLNIGSYNLIFG